MAGIRPIFIGGCDRSGTTMLGSMLGNLPGSVVTPESQFKLDALKECNAEELETYWAFIRHNWRFKLWDLPVPADLPSDMTSYRSLLGWLVREYGRRSGQAQSEDLLWIDHTPDNLREATKLRSLFPDALFIHLVRDGRGVFASVKPLPWGPNTGLRAGEWWLRNVAYGLVAEERLGDSILRLRYEEVLGNPDKALGVFREALALKRSDFTFDGGEFRPPDYTESQHELVGREPQSDKATDWKTRLTRREIELFEYMAWPVLKQFGYEPTGRGASPPSLVERMSLETREYLSRQLGRLQRYSRRIFFTLK